MIGGPIIPVLESGRRVPRPGRRWAVIVTTKSPNKRSVVSDSKRRSEGRPRRDPRPTMSPRSPPAPLLARLDRHQIEHPRARTAIRSGRVGAVASMPESAVCEDPVRHGRAYCVPGPASARSLRCAAILIGLQRQGAVSNGNRHRHRQVGRQAYRFDDIAIVPSGTRDPDDVGISWQLDAFVSSSR